LALPLLAQYLGGGAGTWGGEAMLGFVSAVAVTTILAVVSGLTLSTSGAIAHDFYVNWVKGGHIEERREVWIARVSAVVIGILAIALGILAQGVNVAVLVILAICIAASVSLQTELENIDRAARILPQRHSDLFFILEHHITLTRTQLASRVSLRSGVER
jgi:Na+(H+)/acetate symporter ActP